MAEVMPVADFMVVRWAAGVPPTVAAGLLDKPATCAVINTPTRATLTPGTETGAPGTDTATGDTGTMISTIIIVFLSGSSRTGIQGGGITIGDILTTRITGMTIPIITTRTTATIPAKTDLRGPASKC